jgi:hypothetical protein
MLQTRRREWKRHILAHETVTGNEFWYGDQGPRLGDAFTAKKAAERQKLLLEILWRAAKRARRNGESDLALIYEQLAHKLDTCRGNNRCSSSSCAKCYRAFQRARTAAQNELFTVLEKDSGKKVVMVTLIPPGWTFTAPQLANLDINKANRWLRDALAGVGLRRVAISSVDLSLEKGHFQVHWHHATLTRNRKKLSRKLSPRFHRRSEHPRPVHVKATQDLNFAAYQNKGIKLPDLLRRGRRVLPQLLLALDRTEPLDFWVLTRCRMSVRTGQLELKAVNKK